MGMMAAPGRRLWPHQPGTILRPKGDLKRKYVLLDDQFLDPVQTKLTAPASRNPFLADAVFWDQGFLLSQE